MGRNPNVEVRARARWPELVGKRQSFCSGRALCLKVLLVLFLVVSNVSMQLCNSVICYGGIDDHKDLVAPAAEAETAKQYEDWVDEQRKAFARDPFSYAKERAKIFMQDGRAEGLDPKSAEYHRVALEANLEAQRSLSGGSLSLSVMSNADRDRYKVMLWGREGTGGPIDPQSSYQAMQELLERYQDISHLRIAFSDLGLNIAMAPIFKAIGPLNMDLIRVGVLASVQTIDEQSQYAANILHINQKNEQAKRLELTRDMYNSEWIRTVFGPGWDDVVQRQNYAKAIEVVATMLMVTGTSVDEFCTIIGVPPDKSWLTKWKQKIYGWLSSEGQ